MVNGWFFVFLDSFFRVSFTTLLTLFWLFYLDRIRHVYQFYVIIYSFQEGKPIAHDISAIAKLIASGVYFLFGTVMYTWQE